MVAEEIQNKYNMLMLTEKPAETIYEPHSSLQNVQYKCQK
jgi:hypothetical protein